MRNPVLFFLSAVPCFGNRRNRVFPGFAVPLWAVVLAVVLLMWPGPAPALPESGSGSGARTESGPAFLSEFFGDGSKTSGPLAILRGADNVPWLRLRPAGALEWDNGALTGELRLDPTPLDTPWIRGMVQGRARIRLQGRVVELESLRLEMDEAWIPSREAEPDAVGVFGGPSNAGPIAGQGAGRGTVLRGLRITGSGRWMPDRAALELEEMECSWTGGRLRGQGDWNLDQGMRLRSQLTVSDGAAFTAMLVKVFPRSLAAFQNPATKATGANTGLRGPLDIQVNLDLKPVQPDADQSATPGGQAATSWEWNWDLDLRRPLRFVLPSSGGGAGHGDTIPPLRMQARMRPGKDREWRISGRVAPRDVLLPESLGLGVSALEFDAEVASGRYTFHTVRLRAGQGLVLAGKQTGLRDLSLRGIFTPRGDQGWQAENWRVQLPGGVVKGRAVMDANGAGRAELRAGNLHLGQLAPALEELAGLQGWSGQGQLDLAASLYFGTAQAGPRDADDPGGEGLRSEVRLTWRDVGYMSADGLHMGQGLGGSLHLRTRLSMQTLRRWINAELRLEQGEVLFGPTYLNISKHPLHFTGNANQIGADRFKDLRAGLEWQGFGHVRANGDLWAHGPLAEWRCRAALEVEQLDLGSVFSAFVSSPLGLTRWQGPEAGLGGAGELKLQLYSDGVHADVQGRVRLADVSLRSAAGDVDVSGAHLDMPVRYRLKGAADAPDRHKVAARDEGSLLVEHLRTPWSERGNLALRLALVPNRLYILDTIRIPLFGGRIRLENAQCDAPLSPEFALAADVRFKDIDLGQWARENVPLAGMLRGDLGRVTFTRQRIHVPGAVEGTFFNGDLRVDQLFVDQPLEARRQFGGEASVRRLDLERLSAALGVGRITGLMDLDLQNFLFAYGQPARFRLTAQTSGRGNFEKSVSLKAVNSLSVIGTGSGVGDVGVGLFASFFQEFSYARIGFQCILNNDRFQVRGLIHEGGVEYLIKKPFLTGINVVNGNPENFISFADMLERMQRVVKGPGTGPPR